MGQYVFTFKLTNFLDHSEEKNIIAPTRQVAWAAIATHIGFIINPSIKAIELINDRRIVNEIKESLERQITWAEVQRLSQNASW